MGFSLQKKFSCWLSHKGIFLIFPFVLWYTYHRMFIWGVSLYRMDQFMFMASLCATAYLLINFIVFLSRASVINVSINGRKALVNGERHSLDKIIIKFKGSSYKICLSFRSNIFWSSPSGFTSGKSMDEFVSSLADINGVEIEVVKDNSEI